MKPILKNGWRIYFHPLFYQQWQELVNKVKYLKKKLQPEKFVTHRDVKLLKALDIGIKDKITSSPFASYFCLKKPKIWSSQKNGTSFKVQIVFSSFSRSKYYHNSLARFSS